MRRHLPYCHPLSPLTLLNFSHILTNTKFVHVTSTYYHSWYLVFEFIFSASNTEYHILCSWKDLQILGSHQLYMPKISPITVGKMVVWANEDGLATDAGLVRHCALLSSYYYFIIMKRMWIWYYNRCDIRLGHAVALTLKRCVSYLR